MTFKEKIEVGGLCTTAPSLQKTKRKENKAFFLGGAGGCTKANMSVAVRGNFHVKGYMSKEAR